MRKLVLLTLLGMVYLIGSSAVAQPKITEIGFYVNGVPGNQAGYGNITVELVFDTDMNQAIDPIIDYGLVGSGYPLTLPAAGDWESSRIWQGQFTITKNVPSTSDGEYVFKIYNAESATSTAMDTTFSKDIDNTSLFIGRSGQLVLSTDSLFYGKIRSGQSKDLQLTLQNTSFIDLNISEMTVGSPFTILHDHTNIVIPGNSSLEIMIRFSPSNRARYKTNLVINSNDRNQSVHTVYLSGTAAGPKMHLSTDGPLNFGKVKVDSSTSRSFWITNVQATDTTLSDTLHISEMSTNDPSFIVSVSELTIAPTDTDTVTVTFKPLKYQNYYQYRLTFLTDDFNQPSKVFILNGNAADETPPSEITGLNINWSGYNGYVNSDKINICWGNPSDPSGIAEIWWKFTREPNPPSSANDTTKFGGMYSLESGQTCFYLPLYSKIISGRWYCYIWLVDGYGNSGYLNAVHTYFIYDRTPPGIPAILGRSIPGHTWFSDIHTFSLTISIPKDPFLDDVDASEIRWKYKTNPGSATDYTGKIPVVLDERNQTTFTIPFNSQSLCGEDSVYFWLADSAGNCSADSFAVARYKFDMCPPTISRIASNQDFATLGYDFENTFTITDHSSVEAAWAKYRFGGATAEEPKILLTQLERSDDFQLIIHKAGVTRRGIEFRVFAKDSLGNESYWPNGAKYDGDNQWFSIQTRVEGDGDYRIDTDGRPVPLISGDDESGFQLFSVPYELDDSSLKAVLDDDLGNYDTKTWRIFDYYQEESDTSLWREGENIRPFAPGRSYFLITNKENIVVDSGPGKTIKTVISDTLTLENGWNLIATPFNFPLHKSSLSFVSSDYPISLRSYEQGWNITDVMHPWKGYALYATRTEDDTSKGPIKLVLQPQAAPGRIAKENTIPIELQENEWLIRISGETGLLHDNENWIGYRRYSKQEFDKLELAEPPVIGTYLSVSIPHPDWGKTISNYSTDFRPNRNDDQVWEFEVKTNKKNSEIALSFDSIGSLPQEKEIYLYDPQLKIVRNLKSNLSYSFHSNNDRTQRKLKLIFGTKKFAQIQTALDDLVPTEFKVYQNFPNPFNPATSIRFDIPEPSNVQIHIYNLKGQEIRKLTDKQFDAGFHNVVWDARDDSGDQVAAGIYMFKIIAGNQIQTRKMLFLK